MSVKLKRIQSEMCKVISDIIANSASDSLLKSVTITGSEISGDLSSAKVYFTFFGELTKEQMEKEMNEASGYIRGEVSQKMDLRHTPTLKFIYDESVEYGSKIEKIIEELKKDNM